uniref:Uncharacterized protein n=1 Tax=Meloidogyne hapla TaxID=6305 RepID=A0A1I8BA86_MELHA
MTEPTPSSSKLGKKPKWYFADEELARLPSRMSMDSATELKYRREAAEFIQEMAERLNHNVPQHRGQINQNCICIAMIHMHRFFTVHAFTFFNGHKIPETDGCLWFNSIDPDMTVGLLNKLTDEFTRVYKECKDCHARRFIQKSKNGPIIAKSIAQLPPPPSPPVLQTTNLIKKENGINNTTTHSRSQSSSTNHSIKSSPIC